jgi:hypothetical protein
MFSRTTRLSFLLLLVVLMAGVASAGPILISVAPGQSYLRIDPTDSANPSGVVFINLSSIPGAVGGATLKMDSVGGLCFVGATTCQLTALGAVFSVDSTTAASSNTLQRVLTAVGPPSGILDLATPNTVGGNLSTNFTGDFSVPNGSILSVVIPATAHFLAVGVVDSRYSDNGIWEGHPLGIELEVSSIPEPGTLVLLASGFGLLCAFLRKRRTS